MLALTTYIKVSAIFMVGLYISYKRGLVLLLQHGLFPDAYIQIIDEPALFLCPF